MGLLQKACETYDCHASLVGLPQAEKETLAHRTVAENVVKNAPSPLPEIFSRLGQGIIPGKRPKIGFHNQ